MYVFVHMSDLHEKNKTHCFYVHVLIYAFRKCLTPSQFLLHNLKKRKLCAELLSQVLDIVVFKHFKANYCKAFPEDTHSCVCQHGPPNQI